MTNKYINLIKNIAIFALGSIGSKVIVFLLVPLYTNYLTTEEYGIADLVFTVAQLIVPIVSLVIFDSVIRFGLEYSEHPEKVLHNGIVVWFFGNIFSLIALPLTNLYPSVGSWKWHLYLYILLDSLLAIELNYLKVKNKNISYAITCIIQTFFVAVFNIVFLVYLDMGINGYLISTVFAMLIAVIVAALFGNTIKDFLSVKTDSQLLKSMVKFSTPLVINNLAWWIIQSSNKMFIEVLLGSAALGLFTVATRIPSLINVVVSVFQQAWGISSVVEMDTTKDSDFFSNVFKLFTVGVFFASIILNSIIKLFMWIYVGNDFFSAWRYVPLLVGAAAFSAIAAYFGSLYGALKKSINNMASTLSAGILNIVIASVLIPLMGIWGAVIGTISAYFCLAAFRLIDIKRYIRFSIQYQTLIVNGMIVIVHAVLVSTDRLPLWGSVLVLLMFLIFNFRDIKFFIGQIFKKIRNHKI